MSISADDKIRMSCFAGFTQLAAIGDFDASQPRGGSAAAVAEPSSLALIAIGCLAVLPLRCRHY